MTKARAINLKLRMAITIMYGLTSMREFER